MENSDDLERLIPRKATNQVISKSRYRSEQPIINPKRHVNVDKFYCWPGSPAGSFRSLKDITSTTRIQPDKFQRANTFSATTEEIDLHSFYEIARRHSLINSGRMFFRDKKTLTRGEREIIQGIYKNRGDIIAADTFGKSEFQVKCHKDAWYVGKSTYRGLGGDKTIFKGVRLDNSHSKSCYLHNTSDKSYTSTVRREIGNEDTLFHFPRNKAESHNSDNKGQKVKVQSSETILLNQVNQENFYKAKIIAQAQNYYCNESSSIPFDALDHSRLYDLIHHHPLFDKLLDLRPTLSFGKTSQTGSIPAHCTNYKFINAYEKLRPDFYHSCQTEPCLKCSPMLLNLVLNDFSAVSVESSSYDEVRNVRTNQQRMNNGDVCKAVISNNYQQINKTHFGVCSRDSVDISDEQKEESHVTNLNERLKVIVYVPTAESDHIDNLTPEVGSPKQRPLNKKTQLKIRNVTRQKIANDN